MPTRLPFCEKTGAIDALFCVRVNDAGKETHGALNVFLEMELHDKARVVGFIRRKSLSEIIRVALRDRLISNVDEKAGLVLTEKDDRRLQYVLAANEFVSPGEAQKSPSER